MKDCLLIVAWLLVAFVVISWASAPSTVYSEHTRAIAAEAQVVALQTQVATLQPTPRPCIGPAPYFPRTC